ncbi:rhodanese-like domain-containing protein [Nocardia paucivorans]|uniref:rhodanese-like domain-containing protein n=1 Tax=Nocardia paucivorans TaxID=114259 RepID=UPI0002F3EA73|nr:rhodanese-like domain-containing protein [Nocardia paucivorans]
MTSFDIPSVPVEAVPAEFDIAATGPGDGTEPTILLDVREDDEWQLGHAPGAVHIPLSDIPARTDELDPDAQLYVVCRQGGRSIEAVKYLNRIGFEAVHVEGGMVAWQRLGRPLTAEGDRVAKIY